MNGLECSGFVNWALRNGRVGLGDWTTRMFSRDGFCKIDGKLTRNYKCKNAVNHVTSKLPKDVEGNPWKESYSNQNNALTSAYAKLSKLTDGDFRKLTGKTKSQLQDIFDDVRAGDLLWRGSYISTSANTYKNGHIAMIIGIKRDSNGHATAVHVGEAVQRNGNKLSKLTLDGTWSFCASKWVDKKYNYASYVIKMDNVYNYYTDKYKITTASGSSDKLCKGKTGGNCYKYTEMYNTKFNTAIQNASF